MLFIQTLALYKSFTYLLTVFSIVYIFNSLDLCGVLSDARILIYLTQFVDIIGWMTRRESSL